MREGANCWDSSGSKVDQDIYCQNEDARKIINHSFNYTVVHTSDRRILHHITYEYAYYAGVLLLSDLSQVI